MKSLQLKPSQHKIAKCVLTMIKPLRIFQFLAVLLLFACTVFMITMDPTPIGSLPCILLIVLSGVYVFVLAIELIGQFSKGGSHVFPIFAFSLLGAFLFSIAGIWLILNDYTDLSVQIAATVLCLLAATMFLIDITMVLAFWKSRCSYCRRCCNDTSEIFLRKSEEPHLTDVEVTQVRQDTTTSVSDVRLPSELEKIANEILLPEHCYRKVQNARRRQYVDCPTCVPSLCNLGVAQIQTEPKNSSIVEIQTPTAVTKETPMQTSSKCEFCQRMMRPGDDACGPLCSQDPSQWTAFPAILQIVRGTGMPCCPKCKCSNDATQTQQQPQQSTKEHTKRHTQQVPGSSYKDDTLTSERTEQVASKSDIIIKSFDNSGSVNTTDKEITRPVGMTESVTPAALYMTSTKRHQTSSNLHVDPAYKGKVEITEAREDTRRTDDEASTQDVGRVLARETIATIATVEKFKRDLTSVEPAAEQAKENTIVTLQEDTREKNNTKYKSSTDKERIEKGEKISVEEEKHNDGLTERNKGGGEEGIRVWHQFMCLTERGNMARTKQSPRPSVSTQVNATQIISPTRKVNRTSKVFSPLKLNKVDPVDNISIFDENRVSGRPRHEASETTHVNRARGDEFTELSSPVENQVKDACSFCERQGFTPTSDNYRYYSVYMDKRRYLCELCAPLYCKKVIRKINITYPKGLRCSNCGVSLQVIEAKVPLKSKICPKCGRSQKHAASRSSM